MVEKNFENSYYVQRTKSINGHLKIVRKLVKKKMISEEQATEIFKNLFILAKD